MTELFYNTSVYLIILITYLILDYCKVTIINFDVLLDLSVYTVYYENHY